MKKYFKISLLLVLILVTGFFYGYFVHRNKIFPYKIINKTYLSFIIKNRSYWSIGIFEGSSPFTLIDPENISNPVLSAKDVDDIDAGLVADPFMVIRSDGYYMFFEVLNLETNQGDIGYAVSIDGKNWEYKKIILDEKFHLSYPLVFEWNDNYYLIPESGEDSSVRIYKAISFPDIWEYKGNLLSGSYLNDPTIFYFNNKWWMFVSNEHHEDLYLYYSEHLFSDWKPHTLNPVVKQNKHIANPGGRVIVYNDKLYRMAMDAFPVYGIQVFAMEITELTDTTYEEKLASEIPVVSMTNKGWNAAGMHHVDLHQTGDKWIAAVDGIKRRFKH